MADRNDIQAIKDRIDVVGVISRYLSLTPSGAGYKGRCPFHKDDTPSFVVSPEKGLWHCFGCGEGGDLFGFLMKIERISFPEAVDRLAEEAGVRITRRSNGDRDRLFEINAAVESYFAENLTEHPAAEKARSYLQGRGLDKPAQERFGLGYALPGWDNLKVRFARNHSVKTLKELGLLAEKEGRTYDRFRDRIIFPIFDLSGRPIAFGGRAFEGEPKYLNSPQTPLFDKGRQLYGLSWARERLRELRTAILVEGYTDVLSLHLAGITQAVGSMGTALTQTQADLLGRFVDAVVILYDRDAAGEAASLRGMRILRNSGLEVRVAVLPDGQDPDSLVRRDGADRLMEVVESADPFHLFYVATVVRRHPIDTLRGKELALEETREFFPQLTNIPLRNAIISEFALRLGMGERDVRTSLENRRVHEGEQVTERLESQTPEAIILTLLLGGYVPWARVADHLSSEDFSEVHRPIVAALATSESPDVAEVVAQMDEEAARRASYFALAPVTFTDTDKALADAMKKLIQEPATARRLAALWVEINRCKETGDRERLDELTRDHHALVTERLARRNKDAEA